MGYRTSAIDVIAGDIRIARDALRRFERRTLIPFSNAGPGALAECDDPAARRIVRMPSGEEGISDEQTLTAFLSLTTGSGDVVVTWEGGDSFSGYRVSDGRVTEMLVQFTLVPKP